MIIYIARHGQNEDNAEGILNGHRDKPLTDIGVAQAHELAKGMKAQGVQIDHVYSSPLSRAYTTARIVSSTLNLPTPKIHDLLIERDFGVMTGKKASDIKNLCGSDVIETNTITYFLSPDGAETFPELVGRAKRLTLELAENHRDESLLLVTHGDFGKMIYAAFYQLTWKEVLTKFHFGNCELLVLEMGADTDKPHIITIDQHNH